MLKKAMALHGAVLEEDGVLRIDCEGHQLLAIQGQHVYSIAVPEAEVVWAAALLRYLVAHAKDTGADLRIGDHMPLGYPITQIADPDARGTALDTLLFGAEPVLESTGDDTFRRVVGVHPVELALIETWNSSGFLYEWSQHDPRLLTDPDRNSVLHGELAAHCRSRAAEEGSSIGKLFFEGGWSETDDQGLELHLPGGTEARRIKDILHARLPYDRPLFLIGPEGAGTVAFIPDRDFRAELQDDQLVFYGNLHNRELQQILTFLQPEGPGSVVKLG